ncbi:hypothetical protein KFU94_68650 [Chloroflexi bacterium TSY]|nr:hypothetical protein [Chloroflexi bacterium TSY]
MDETMARMGIAEFAERPPHHLSGKEDGGDCRRTGHASATRHMTNRAQI